MGNAHEVRTLTMVPINQPPKSTGVDVSGILATLTPGAPTVCDRNPAATAVVYAPLPVLRKEEKLLQRVIVKLVAPEGKGWKLYEKSYGSIYERDHTKTYWARNLNEDDFGAN